MTIYKTTCQSYTGKILYSDTYFKMSDGHTEVEERPFLNSWAAVPVLGIAAGVCRMGLAIIHILGHLLAAWVFLDEGHLYHVAKGGAEFVRGGIEALPFAGRIFAWCYDATPCCCCIGGLGSSGASFENRSWFIVKIYNPDNPDNIDRMLDLPNRL